MLFVIFCILFAFAWIGALLLAMGKAIEDGPGSEYASHDGDYVAEVMRKAREEGDLDAIAASRKSENA